MRLLMRENAVEGEVVTSGHSIDICLACQSKEDLVHAMQMSFGLKDGPVLRIGDRGQAPGNDWRPLGRSVWSERRRGEQTPDALLVSHTCGYEGRASDVLLLAQPALVGRRRTRTHTAKPFESGVEVRDATRFSRDPARQDYGMG